MNDMMSANKTIAVGGMAREKFLAVFALVVFGPLAVWQLMNDPFDDRFTAFFVFMAAVGLFSIFRIFLFKVEADANGVKVRKLFGTHRYPYASITNVTIKPHINKQSASVEIHVNGKIAAYFNDLTKNADLLVAKMQANGVTILDDRRL